TRNSVDVLQVVHDHQADAAPGLGLPRRRGDLSHRLAWRVVDADRPPPHAVRPESLQDAVALSLVDLAPAQAAAAHLGVLAEEPVAQLGVGLLQAAHEDADTLQARDLADQVAGQHRLADRGACGNHDQLGVVEAGDELVQAPPSRLDVGQPNFAVLARAATR